MHKILIKLINVVKANHIFLRVLFQDDVNLQFATGVKVYGDNIFVLTSRFQNYYVDDVKDNEVNYRINAGKVSDLIRGTKCQVNTNAFISYGPPYGVSQPFPTG